MVTKKSQTTLLFFFKKKKSSYDAILFLKFFAVPVLALVKSIPNIGEFLEWIKNKRAMVKESEK